MRRNSWKQTWSGNCAASEEVQLKRFLLSVWEIPISNCIFSQLAFTAHQQSSAYSIRPTWFNSSSPFRSICVKPETGLNLFYNLSPISCLYGTVLNTKFFSGWEYLVVLVFPIEFIQIVIFPLNFLWDREKSKNNSQCWQTPVMKQILKWGYMPVFNSNLVL